MRTITLKCSNCGKAYEKNEALAKQALTRGLVNTYCTRKCSLEGNLKNRTGWRKYGIYLGKTKDKV